MQEPIGVSLPTNESSESSIDIVLWLQLEDVGSADVSIVSVRKKTPCWGSLLGFKGSCMFLKVECSVVRDLHWYDLNHRKKLNGLARVAATSPYIVTAIQGAQWLGITSSSVPWTACCQRKFSLSPKHGACVLAVFDSRIGVETSSMREWWKMWRNTNSSFRTRWRLGAQVSSYLDFEGLCAERAASRGKSSTEAQGISNSSSYI